MAIKIETNYPLVFELVKKDKKLLEILYRYNILTLETLSEKTEHDMLMIKNLGPKRLFLLQKILDENNLMMRNN